MTGEPLERRLRANARQSGVLRELVEKDYALSYALAGIMAVSELAGTFVFKGGTSLRKAWFADYRLSEDLDFTCAAGVCTDLRRRMEAAAAHAVRLLAPYGSFDVAVSTYPVRDPHPGGQQAFRLHVRFPWQSRPLCTVKVEVTADEPVALPPVGLPLLHVYDEPLVVRLQCYALEEVVAEKLRALLQTKARLEQRGWARPRSRDYYDLWQLLCRREATIDPGAVRRILPDKCRVRNVAFESVDDFFADQLLERARADWHGDLRRVAQEMPDFDVMLAETRPAVARLVAVG